MSTIVYTPGEMKLVTRWSDGACLGCSKHGYVEEKTLLCFWCFGLMAEVERRKRKLDTTLHARLGLSHATFEQMRHNLAGLSAAPR